MIERGDFRKVRDAMLDAVCPVSTEKAALELAAGRILARDIVAASGILYRGFPFFIIFPQKTPASAGGEMNAAC